MHDALDDGFKPSERQVISVTIVRCKLVFWVSGSQDKVLRTLSAMVWGQGDLEPTDF